MIEYKGVSKWTGAAHSSWSPRCWGAVGFEVVIIIIIIIIFSFNIQSDTPQNVYK